MNTPRSIAYRKATARFKPTPELHMTGLAFVVYTSGVALVGIAIGAALVAEIGGAI